MAVPENLYNATESLILAKPRRRVRTGVRWQHWQLRSLVGTDEHKGHNYVYFPVPAPDNRSSQVHSLDFETRETAIVKRLSFNPRCLVARNGWVCCGGELGIFTAFRVGERRRLHEADRAPDSPDSERILGEINGFIAGGGPLPPSEKDLLTRSNAFGKDRVNCITLWFPPTLFNAVEGAYDQDVAVLANNDSSVIVVSLRDQEALDKITYPDYMNRGVISPDGRLLVAISDDPYLYIHERKEKKSEANLPFRMADRPTYGWSSCGRIQLKSQRKDDRSDNRGSFAACFSSTGRYLAVGTQYGTISIFDATLLGVSGADPLLTWFNTSRSDVEFGAVRDMAFAPGPIDLLAWTENRGRVGVADIRTGFDARQILHLDKEDDFEHLGVNEEDSVIDRCTIDPRLLEQRADRGDRAVLEAIQDYRRRQDQYGTSPTRTGAESTNNGAATTGASGRPAPIERTLRTEAARIREQRITANRTTNELSQRDRLRAQDENGNGSATNNSTADRRRYAAIDPFSAAATAAAAAPSTTTLAGTGTGGSRGALISRLLASATNPTFPDTSGLRNADALAAYFMRDWEEGPGRRGGLGTFGVAAHTRLGPYDTAGLSWSEDGQRLFVGAENGIFEFRVDLFGRMCSPSVTLS